MKRLIVAALVAALAASIAAVAFAGAGPAPTKEAGKLIVGINPPAAGFTVGKINSDNSISNPRGFEIDLANAIGQRLGLEVVFLNSPFTGLFRPGPKPFDFAFEQITITPQRDKVVDFSTPYFDANQGVLLAKGVKSPKNRSDLRQLQTCSQATTTGLDWIKTKLRPPKPPQVYQTLAAAFQAVAIGRCQAIVMDVPISASEKKTHPTKYGPLAGQIVTNEQYGALFEQGSPLKATIDQQLKALIANGTVGKLQKKWFGLNFGNIPVLR